MGWQEKINKDIEKFFKTIFNDEDIKKRLRSDRNGLLYLLSELTITKAKLEDDISDINKMPFDTKISFYAKEQLYDYLFQIKQIIIYTNNFIEYCNKTIGDVTTIGDKDEKE